MTIQQIGSNEIKVINSQEEGTISKGESSSLLKKFTLKFVNKIRASLDVGNDVEVRKKLSSLLKEGGFPTHIS